MKDFADLVDALAARGAGNIAHSNSSLLKHLETTAEVLADRGADEITCKAGLFHSVYGTEKFPNGIFSFEDRRKVVELIGKEAESLVYAYALSSRDALLRLGAAVSAQFILVPSVKPGACLRLLSSTFRRLQEIARANEITLKLEIGNLRTPTLFSKVRETSFEANDKQPFVLIGVPSNAGSKHRGTKDGPALAREALAKLMFRSPSIDSLFDVEHGRYVFAKAIVMDLGDAPIISADVQNAWQEVFRFAAEVRQHGTVIAIGGDHSFSAPLFLAAAEQHNAIYIHIDQHIDCQVWGEFDQNLPKRLTARSHSNFLSYLRDELPDIRMLQLGGQKYVSVPAKTEDQRIQVGRYIMDIAHRISDVDLEQMDESDLSKALPNGECVYISIDVDVLNRSFMTMTPYPAHSGISFARLTQILRFLILRNKVIGLDIMEFGLPETGHNELDKRLIAYLICEVFSNLSNKFDQI